MRRPTYIVLFITAISLIFTSLVIFDADLLKIPLKKTPSQEDVGEIDSVPEKRSPEDGIAAVKALPNAASPPPVFTRRFSVNGVVDETAIASAVPRGGNFGQVMDSDAPDQGFMEPSGDNIHVTPTGPYTEEILAGERSTDDTAEVYDADGNVVIQPSVDNIDAMPTGEFAQEITVGQSSAGKMTHNDVSTGETLMEPSVENMNQMPTGEYAEQILAGLREGE